MRILFCNTTYLRYYDGRIDGELTPKSGGKWVSENEDAHEKWNFLNMDGYCYGFVQGNSEQMHIEKIDSSFRKREYGDDVTVVWCAKHPDKDETVIVGWYEHATVYRYYQYLPTTPLTGLDRAYFFSTKAENAYLLPEEERTMRIGRAAKTGMGTGFGQYNYWYAESSYAKENLIPKVTEFISTKRNKRINVLNDAFDRPIELFPLTAEELDKVKDIAAVSDMEFLPLAYRMYNNEPTADNAYNVGAVLSNMFQYKLSIPWYEKTVELDSADWETKGMLACVYSQCGEYVKFIKLAEELLANPNDFDPDFKDGLYCMLADTYYSRGNIETAISYLDRTMKESKNKELTEHIRYTKNIWMSK